MSTKDNAFRFTSSDSLTGVTAMSAKIVDFAYDKHLHEEFSIGVTLSGRQDFYCAGKYHKSQPGNVMVFNPGEVHDGHSGQKNALRYTMLYLCPRLLNSMMRASGAKYQTEYRAGEILQNNKAIRGVVLALAQLIENGQTPSLEAESHLYTLAALLAQQYIGDPERLTRYKKIVQIKQAADFIRDNLNTDLTIDEISRAVGLSKYHFIRLFKQSLGITPYQFILNCRINSGKRALGQGRSVTDVAIEHGFADVSHFNRRFIPLVGMTPYQYQKQLTTN